MQKIDLTRKRFSRLTVLGEVGRDKHKKILWKVRCDCGIEKIVIGLNLKKGDTKSCGCYFREMRSGIRSDLKGQKFGRLVVLCKDGKGKYRHTLWLCRCDCGVKKAISGISLTSGKTKSCGCLRIDGLSGEKNLKYKLGKSGTSEYRNYASKKRREKKKFLKENELWSFEMEQSCREFFTGCILCCSTKKLTIDHVYSLGNGFPLQIGNAVVLCKHHNSWKSSKWLHELGQQYIILFERAANSFTMYWNKINQDFYDDWMKII